MFENFILPLLQVTPVEADPTGVEAVLEAENWAEQFVATAVALTTKYGMNVVGAIVILVAGNMIAKFASRKTETLLLRKKEIDPSLASIARQVVYIGLMIVVVIAVLNKFGVETTSLVALLGTAGLAIGLALQGTLSNIAAGVMILFLKPFRAGNAVRIGGGDIYLVDEIGLFVTRAHQPDCPRVMIPNSKIWGSIIVNFSDTVNSHRRFDIAFSVSYGDDLNKALRILEDLAASDARVLKEPAPFIKVDTLGESSVNILFRVHTLATDWWPAKLELTKAGKEALEAGGCKIPFPQRDVHLYQSEKESLA